jgi:hypothetical protein
MDYFEDSNDRVILQRRDRRLELGRAFFLQQESKYRLPDGYRQRIYKDGIHCLFSEDSQVLAKDITQAKIEAYLAKIPTYMEALPKVDPTEPISDLKDFSKLEKILRGSSAWGKMFLAMNQSLRANAAGSLIMVSIAATRNEGDLRSGFQALIYAMATQSSVTAFSDEEIELIQSALTDSGFDAKYFFE